MNMRERNRRLKMQSILHRYRDEKSLSTIDAIRELETLDLEYAHAIIVPEWADAAMDAIVMLAEKGKGK